jgi:DNA invertase Pin-like site-specific DNA recombinase
VGVRIDGVLVARFDRFARSTKHLVTALEEFQALGVDFVSLGKSVDTSTPMGKLLFTVLGAVAELERSLIKERVAMGLERARKEGKPHGRPKRVFDREKAQRLRDEGKSFREIGRILRVNKGTIAGQIRK